MNRVRRTPWPVLLAGALVLLQAGCNQTPVKPAPAVVLPSGYTCCNFHHEKDAINDANFGALPMIPAGSPIRVTGYEPYRAFAEIDGKPFTLVLEYGRAAETTEQWVARLVVAGDPRLKLADYPPAVRQAIQSGRIMVGMGKDQVIMALGHPLTNENPRLGAPYWRYWRSKLDEFQVHWLNERVSKVTGAPGTLESILAPGNAAPPPPPAALVPAPPAPVVVPPSPAAKPAGKNQGGTIRGKSKPSSAGN